MVREGAAAMLALWSAVSLVHAQEAVPAPAPAPAPLLTPPAAPVEEAPAAPVEESNAPPSLDGATDNAPPSLVQEAPSAAPVESSPAVERPFAARVGGLELGLMAASLGAGWALAGVAGVGTAIATASWGSGRLAWDWPRGVLDMVRRPGDDTEGARVLSGQNAGVMAAGLAFAALAGAVLAAGITTALGALSPEWETAMGPAAAAGLLAGAACLGLGGVMFIASLAVPFPPLWLATFTLALAAGVVLPPVAVVGAALLTKKARAVPGGLIQAILRSVPMNPLARPMPGA